MDVKQCNLCSKSKPLNEFYYRSDTKDSRTYRCKSCNNQYNKGWFSKNNNKMRVYSQNSRNRTRFIVFKMLSNGNDVICVKTKEWNCCNPQSELYLRCLTLDHINDDGNVHRKKIGKHIYSWAKLHPEEAKKELQILCINAQLMKEVIFLTKDTIKVQEEVAPLTISNVPTKIKKKLDKNGYCQHYIQGDGYCRSCDG